MTRSHPGTRPLSKQALVRLRHVFGEEHPEVATEVTQSTELGIRGVLWIV